jgi:hypothetical protein
MALQREAIGRAFFERRVDTNVGDLMQAGANVLLAWTTSTGSLWPACNGLKNDPRMYRWKRSTLPFVCAR